jgi:hypothetical protein
VTLTVLFQLGGVYAVVQLTQKVTEKPVLLAWLEVGVDTLDQTKLILHLGECTLVSLRIHNLLYYHVFDCGCAPVILYASVSHFLLLRRTLKSLLLLLYKLLEFVNFAMA